MDLTTVASLLSRTNTKSAISILSILVDGLSAFANEYSRAKLDTSPAGSTGTLAGDPIITSLSSAILHVLAAHDAVKEKVGSANVPPVQM